VLVFNKTGPKNPEWKADVNWVTFPAMRSGNKKAGAMVKTDKVAERREQYLAWVTLSRATSILTSYW